MRRRNPRNLILTADQERLYEAAEGSLTRARILQSGVAVLLNEHPTTSESVVAAQMLEEAVDLHRSASEIRQRLRDEAEQTNPTPHKRKPRTV